MKIERINLSELRPLENNVRKHNEKQIAELIRSVNQFGQTRAIIIDEDNNILIGNGLYFALKQRGDKDCECSRVTGLSEKDKKKLVLTDNKVFSLGTDDYEQITAYIEDITADGDFDIAGFDDEVLKQMTRELEEVHEDLMNYGVITNPTPIPSTPASSGADNFNTVPASQYNPVSEPTQPVYTEPARPQAAAEVHNDRKVICPSCGEVIHLD